MLWKQYDLSLMSISYSEGGCTMGKFIGFIIVLFVLVSFDATYWIILGLIALILFISLALSIKSSQPTSSNNIIQQTTNNVKADTTNVKADTTYVTMNNYYDNRTVNNYHNTRTEHHYHYNGNTSHSSLNTMDKYKPTYQTYNTVTLKGYETFLKGEGKSEYTKSGHRSTIYDYSSRVERVCRDENITLNELANKITYYVHLYDIGGLKQHIGNKSNRSVINALKGFQRYVESGRRVIIR